MRILEVGSGQVHAALESPAELGMEVERIEGSLDTFDQGTNAFQFIRPLRGIASRMSRDLDGKGDAPGAWQQVFINRKVFALLNDLFPTVTIVASTWDASLCEEGESEKLDEQAPAGLQKNLAADCLIPRVRAIGEIDPQAPFESNSDT